MLNVQIQLEATPVLVMMTIMVMDITVGVSKINHVYFFALIDYSE